MANQDWTKNDCARVIVKALMNMDEAPAADHFEVKRVERAHNKARLIELRDQAIETITRREIHGV